MLSANSGMKMDGLFLAVFPNIDSFLFYSFQIQLGFGCPPLMPGVIDMTTHQFLAGTDIASIGIWDQKWSNCSIREKSLGMFLKRLAADAERRQLF
jgi:hypothetical protein